MKILLTAFACFFVLVLTAQEKNSLTIHFDFDKHTLTTEARSSLDSLLTLASQDKTTHTFKLYGHCDFIGSDGYNNDLSSRRVNTVKRYLLTKGVVDKTITDAIAYGEKQPLNDNKTAGDRQLNRRVEIVIETMNEPAIANKVSLKEKIADSATITGTQIVLKNINFYGGRHHLLPSSLPMLEELLDAMKTYPKLKIEIQGHICCQPYADDGPDLETGLRNLSAARAEAIHDYLIEKGIDPTRVSHRGFGHSQPIYDFPEQSEEQRKENRRVEIKIISK